MNAVNSQHLLDFFKLLEEVFPLDKADLPSNFSGHHSITLESGNLKINVWWRSKSWGVVLVQTTQADVLPGRSDLENIRNDIEMAASKEG